MKKFASFFIILLTFGIIYSGAILKDFRAKSENESIIVEWETLEETNVNYFGLLRKNINGEYIEIKRFSPKGSYSYYSYRDETAFKTTDRVFVYKLEIACNNNEKSYSREIYVTHNVSSVKRTWGSIKAMFR